MKAYAVRHKPSGLYIPRLETGKRRGGSHLEPSNEREPRLFFNKISARAFLSNWLQGKMILQHGSGWDGDYDSYTKVIPQPHRNKDEMEIVEFDLVETNTQLNMNLKAAS
jgi:hypothetical protein